MDEEGRVCPFCAEDVKDAAIVCKHCGRDLPEVSPAVVENETDPSTTDERVETARKGGLKSLAVAMALAVVVWLVLMAGEDGNPAREGSRADLAPTVPLTPATQSVVYRLDGTTGQVGVTLSNGTGDTEQFDTDLPYERTVIMASGEFAYLSAQKQGGGVGSVTCTIAINGDQVSRATSSAAYGIAGCSE